MKILKFLIAFAFLGLLACKGSRVAETQKSMQAEQQTTTTTNDDIVKSVKTIQNNEQAKASDSSYMHTQKKESKITYVDTTAKKYIPPTFEYDKRGRISKITFANNKTIDVFENNPYNNLDCGTKIRNETFGYNYSSIQNRKVKDFIPDIKSLPYNQKVTGKEEVKDIECLGYVGYSDNKKWTILAYNTIFFSEENNAGTCTFQIYDSLGNFVNKFHELGINILGISLSNDGKYLVHNFGMITESEEIIKEGFRVYDIQTEKVVLEEYGRQAVIRLNLIASELCFEKNDIRYVDCAVYDMYKKKKYFNLFLMTDFDEIDFTMEGYIVGRNSGNRRLLSFEKDFKSEDLK